MEGPKAHIDFETRSATDLKKSGVHRYAEDPTTGVWGFRWRIGDEGLIWEWRPGFPDPVALLEHIARGGIVTAHNAAFERTIWNNVIRARTHAHWPPLLIEQQDCTMSRAAALALPQGLDQLGDALGTNYRKDMDGHRLMMKMAKPRRFNEDGTITWWDDPDDVDRNMDYCGTDVRVETDADNILLPLSERERRVWELDQRINERGVMIDRRRVERSEQLVAYAKKQNDRLMREITGRAVPKCSNDKKIIEWLNGRGVECTSLAKGEIEDVVFLADAASDPTALQAIKLRKAAWKTSTAKYTAMQKCVCADDRIRGMLNYHGASTGRWAGRLVQPQNFPRADHEDEALQSRLSLLNELLDDTTRDVRYVYDFLEVMYGGLEVMELLSKNLRGVLKARDGHKFIGGDFSNIEGRVNAWLAGEAWKLQAFRDYDNGTGDDLYKLAYARAFGVPVSEVTKALRQLGKVMELALGYQGGIGAFLTMGANYGVNPFELSKPVHDATSAEQWDVTAAQYHGKGVNRYGLLEREWTALKVLVDNWRGANPAIVQAWWNYQDAAVAAVAEPGSIQYPDHTARVAYYSDGRILWCILPNGRLLAYMYPELKTERVAYFDKRTGEEKYRIKRTVTFWGVNSKTRQWSKNSLYGGLQCENIVQAASRDIMVDAMFRAEDYGYPIVLTVHDELLTEVPEGATRFNEQHFAALMAQNDNTYEGLPMAVGAWEDKRYVK